MYEELIGRLRICGKTCDGNCTPFGCRMQYNELVEATHSENLYRVRCTAEDAADAIEELQRQIDAWVEPERKALIKSLPKWIPVTERLPECDLGAEVGNIEWISCGMVHAGCFGRGGKYRDAYFRTWTDAGEGMDAKDADYWRAVTFPEPPKEET